MDLANLMPRVSNPALGAPRSGMRVLPVSGNRSFQHHRAEKRPAVDPRTRLQPSIFIPAQPPMQLSLPFDVVPSRAVTTEVSFAARHAD